MKQEFHLEEEKFYTENEFMEDEEDMEEEEEEEEDLTAERGVKKRGGGERRMKMRRVFTITHSRERQRGAASSLVCCQQGAPWLIILPDSYIANIRFCHLFPFFSQRSRGSSDSLQEDPVHLSEGP